MIFASFLTAQWRNKTQDMSSNRKLQNVQVFFLTVHIVNYPGGEDSKNVQLITEFSSSLQIVKINFTNTYVY
jgi:hypothetical protein